MVDRPRFLLVSGKGIAVLLLLVALFAASCGGNSSGIPASFQVITPTSAPTNTPQVTNTPKPTDTPQATNTPKPTDTPQATNTPESVETNEDQGDQPAQIVGEYRYTNPFFSNLFVDNHMVMLIDMHGFVARDPDWEVPVAAQVPGYIAMDTEAQMGEYHLNLPAIPNGMLNDVNPDGEDETGVQIFAIEYMPVVADDPFFVGNDAMTGWSSSDSSVIIATTPQQSGEIIGGKLIIWAPDDQQKFPASFGDDALLFTADDEVMDVPVGYSVIDLDESPFAIIREPVVEVTLYEAEDAGMKDYTDMSYSEAFQELVTVLRTRYAFPEKAPDWDAMEEELLPRIVAAEEDDNVVGFCEALIAFVAAFDDGHVATICNLEEAGGGSFEDFERLFPLGGYGLSIRELDDGTVLAVNVSEGSPAANAGIEQGAEIFTFNGEPITETIRNEPLLIGNSFSTAHTRRLMQEKMAVRAPIDTEAQLSFSNPGITTTETVSMTSILEFESFLFANDTPRTDQLLPVEFEILASGVGYISLNSNLDDMQLTLRLFERALREFEAAMVTDVIIDLRHNGGGIMLGFASFFTDEPLETLYHEYYNEETNEFSPPINSSLPMVEPWERQYFVDRIAILIGPSCASACEGEVYLFSQLNDYSDTAVTLVGHYPTAGMYGEVGRGQFLLAPGVKFQAPFGRSVLPNGEMFIEGTGIAPTLAVPLDREALLGEDDVVFLAAEEALLDQQVANEEAWQELLPPPTEVVTYNAGEVVVRETLGLSLTVIDDWQLPDSGNSQAFLMLRPVDAPLTSTVPLIRMGAGPIEDMFFGVEIDPAGTLDSWIDAMEYDEADILTERTDIVVDGLSGRMLDLRSRDITDGEARFRVVFVKLAGNRLFFLQMATLMDEWDEESFTAIIDAIHFFAPELDPELDSDLAPEPELDPNPELDLELDPNPEDFPSFEEADGEVVNEDGGFAMTAPAGWMVQQEGTNVFLSSPDFEQFILLMSESSEHLAEMFALDEITLESLLAGMESDLNLEGGDSEPIEVAGQQGIVVEVQMNELGQSFTGQIIILELEGERFLVIQAMGLVDVWDTQYVEDVVASLRFLAP